MVTMWFQLILLLTGLVCTALSCPVNCKCAASTSTCLSCTDGFYGVDCKEQCRNTCISCLSEYGCIKCKSGYKSHCNRTCPENCARCASPQKCITCKPGHFGVTCEHECPVNCKKGLCDKNNGYCKRCIDKYHGTRCNQNCSKHCLRCRTTRYCNACEVGFYGFHCQNMCAHCIPGTRCTKNDGYCYDGCSDGYFGFTCSKKCTIECKTCSGVDYACVSCIDGKYGRHWSSFHYSCDKECPVNCANKTCDRDTGNCLACVDGYTGDKCDCPEPCQYCSSTGVCTSCKAGFSDAAKQCKCKRNPCTNDTCEACTNSKWYLDKSSGSCCECSSTCKNRTCISEKRCLNGCIDGYYGENCDKLCQDQNCIECNSTDGHFSGCIKCKDGFYPDDANDTCISCHGTCLFASCSSNNGHCIKGCIDSFWGAKCDKECSTACVKCDQWSGHCLKCQIGTYSSIDCSKKCSKTCNRTEGMLLCSIDDGICMHGCNSETVYGPQCRQLCDDGCFQNKCDRETGRCLLGCGDNFYGDNCNATCSHGCIDVGSGRRCSITNGSCIAGCRAGFFGDRCDVKCSKYCQNDNCSGVEGICVSGCIPGFYGDRCNMKCNKHCMYDACAQSRGVCEFGCIAGFYGDLCDNRCSIYCKNDTCSRSKGVCEFGCIPATGYSGDTTPCNQYMTSYDNQPETHITWTMIGPVIGAGATLVIVISMVAFICRKRRHAVKGKQVGCKLEGFSSRGENRVPGYNNMTLYDFLDDVSMDDNNHRTETPEPETNRIVSAATGLDRNRRAVTEEQVDIPLEIINHPADENRASDYDSVSIYDALCERAEADNEYRTVTPQTGTPRTVIPEPETNCTVTPELETSRTLTPERPRTSQILNPELRTSHIYCNITTGK